MVETIKSQFSVVWREDERGSDAYGLRSASGNEDASVLKLLDDEIAVGDVKGTEGTDVTNVVDARHLGEVVEEVFADASRELEEVFVFNGVENESEHVGAVRVAGPGGVEGIGVRGVWSEMWFGKEPRGLSFFGKDDHVGRIGEVPVRVSPDRSGSQCGLDFIDDKEDVGFGAQCANSASKVVGDVTVPSFTTDGFDEDGGGPLLFKGGAESLDAVVDVVVMEWELCDV